MSLFDRLVVATLPLVPRPVVRRFSARYIAGESLDEALEAVADLNRQGCMATLDVLGEDVTREETCHEAVREYVEALERIDQRGLDSNISIKLTALGLKLNVGFCEERAREILDAARAKGNFVRIDMEDHTCTTDTLAIFHRLREAGYENVGVALQAYLRRTARDLPPLIEKRANIRMCKGIYVEPREVAFQDPRIVTDNFGWLTRTLLEGGCYVGVATHDEQVVWQAERGIRELGLRPEQYEFQMLLGVDEKLRRLLVEAGHRVRVYVPFGRAWYAYSTRRLKENPKVAGYVLRALLAGS
jgi:proline dehydrogenase